jgi:hypothetical protein
LRDLRKELAEESKYKEWKQLRVWVYFASRIFSMVAAGLEALSDGIDSDEEDNVRDIIDQIVDQYVDPIVEELPRGKHWVVDFILPQVTRSIAPAFTGWWNSRVLK